MVSSSATAVFEGRARVNARYKAIAQDVGAWQGIESYDVHLYDFAEAIAGRCAAIGDKYEVAGQSAGDLIRQELCNGLPARAYPRFDFAAEAPRDPMAIFAWAAAVAALGRPETALTPPVVAFAYRVVDLAASLGDKFGDGEAGGNAGEHIRAELYEG